MIGLTVGFEMWKRAAQVQQMAKMISYAEAAQKVNRGNHYSVIRKTHIQSLCQKH